MTEPAGSILTAQSSGQPCLRMNNATSEVGGRAITSTPVEAGDRRGGQIKLLRQCPGGRM